MNNIENIDKALRFISNILSLQLEIRDFTWNETTSNLKSLRKVYLGYNEMIQQEDVLRIRLLYKELLPLEKKLHEIFHSILQVYVSSSYTETMYINFDEFCGILSNILKDIVTTQTKIISRIIRICSKQVEDYSEKMKMMSNYLNEMNGEIKICIGIEKQQKIKLEGEFEVITSIEDVSKKIQYQKNTLLDGYSNSIIVFGSNSKMKTELVTSDNDIFVMYFKPLLLKMNIYNMKLSLSVFDLYKDKYRDMLSSKPKELNLTFSIENIYLSEATEVKFKNLEELKEILSKVKNTKNLPLCYLFNFKKQINQGLFNISKILIWITPNYDPHNKNMKELFNYCLSTKLLILGLFSENKDNETEIMKNLKVLKELKELNQMIVHKKYDLKLSQESFLKLRKENIELRKKADDYLEKYDITISQYSNKLDLLIDENSKLKFSNETKSQKYNDLLKYLDLYASDLPPELQKQLLLLKCKNESMNIPQRSTNEREKFLTPQINTIKKMKSIDERKELVILPSNKIKTTKSFNEIREKFITPNLDTIKKMKSIETMPKQNKIRTNKSVNETIKRRPIPTISNNSVNKPKIINGIPRNLDWKSKKTNTPSRINVVSLETTNRIAKKGGIIRKQKK